MKSRHSIVRSKKQQRHQLQKKRKINVIFWKGRRGVKENNILILNHSKFCVLDRKNEQSIKDMQERHKAKEAEAVKQKEEAFRL